MYVHQVARKGHAHYMMDDLSFTMRFLTIDKRAEFQK